MPTSCVQLCRTTLTCECGFTKPTTRLGMNDKVTLVQSVALHQVILITLGELSQFRDGLETIGVARAIEQKSAFLVLCQEVISSNSRCVKVHLAS